MNPLLMIEDDARLSQMVADYLTQSGYAVLQAGNAQQGLARLQSDPAPALEAESATPPGADPWAGLLEDPEPATSPAPDPTPTPRPARSRPSSSGVGR